MTKLATLVPWSTSHKYPGTLVHFLGVHLPFFPCFVLITTISERWLVVSWFTTRGWSNPGGVNFSAYVWAWIYRYTCVCNAPVTSTYINVCIYIFIYLCACVYHYMHTYFVHTHVHTQLCIILSLCIFLCHISFSLNIFLCHISLAIYVHRHKIHSRPRPGQTTTVLLLYSDKLALAVAAVEGTKVGRGGHHRSPWVTMGQLVMLEMIPRIRLWSSTWSMTSWRQNWWLSCL